MSATVYQSALVDDEDSVHLHDGGEAVGDDDCCFFFHQIPEGGLDHAF